MKLYFTLSFLLFFAYRSGAQYLNPVTPFNPVKGVEFTYFENNQATEPAGLDTMSNFLLSGTLNNFSLSRRLRNDFFTFNFRGYIKVARDTVYTFYTSSDDGSNLYIDTTRVVSNDGTHGDTEKSGTIRLKAGYHKIRVYYHEADGNEILRVSYSSDLLAKAFIPDSVLFRDGFPFPNIAQFTDTTMFEEDTITRAFKLTNPGGNLSSIAVTAFSGTQTSIPDANLLISGTDSNRTIRLISLPTITGSVLIRIKATNSSNKSIVRSFRVNVVSRAPSVSSLSDTFLVVNNSSGNRLVTVSDPDGPASGLVVSATSGNLSLVSNASISVTGTGANRLISFTPVTNATGSATITYKVQDPTSRFQEKSFVVVVGDTGTFRAPDTIQSPAQGLDYLMARADGGSVLNFGTVLPDKAGPINNFSFAPVGTQLDFFGLEYRGFIRIRKAAAYTFFSNSDDGSKVYIGSTEVVDNDGGHGTQERSGSINLKAGFHKITVKYKEGNGGEVLEVRIAGGGSPKRLIPDSLLFRNGFSHPTITATNDTIQAYKLITSSVPFAIADPDGDPAAATTQTFSYTTSIVPLNNLLVSGTGAGRSLDITPAAPGITQVKVVATDAQGLPAIKSFIVKVKDTTLVGIREISSPKGLNKTIVPNPVSDKFTVLGILPEETISISDVKGVLLFTGKPEEASFRNLKKGVYMIRLNSSGKVLRVIH